MARVRNTLLLIGAFLIFLGFKEIHTRGLAKTAPRMLTCERLGSEGPGDNAHVVMTDFLLCDHDFVYEKDEWKGEWTGAWVPAVPSNGAYAERIREIRETEGPYAKLPAPPSFQVVVRIPRARSKADVEAAAAQAQMRGLVVNEIDPLGSDEKDFLKKTYAQANVGECLVLEMGSPPPGARDHLRHVRGRDPAPGRRGPLALDRPPAQQPGGVRRDDRAWWRQPSVIAGRGCRPARVCCMGA